MRPLRLLALGSAATITALGVRFPGNAVPGAPSPTSTAAHAAPVAGSLSPPLSSSSGIANNFHLPAGYYGPGHRGVDLLGRAGQHVHAAAAGVVVHAGNVVDRPVVSVEHRNGTRTTYEPVRPTVSPGERVARGQALGRLAGGHPGCPANPPEACLHWGLRRGDEYFDPLRALPAPEVRLLPW
ncbi:M23 family metallopeptidase [Actinopolyspora mortivallis]|uniref:Peptidase n=1 Tax=Actinopolyspora mortivallis TaxID=33906 RepID=A0A2T0GTU9_ACTMO|nr:peptidoglycan DD-metalloendopeptidase family protein [Actinopolyspora mortivallis]PRW62548.1 peptidase [Actinopolyspora mortivallis]